MCFSVAQKVHWADLPARYAEQHFCLICSSQKTESFSQKCQICFAVEYNTFSDNKNSGLSPDVSVICSTATVWMMHFCIAVTLAFPLKDLHLHF